MNYFLIFLACSDIEIPFITLTAGRPSPTLVKCFGYCAFYFKPRKYVPKSLVGSSEIALIQSFSQCWEPPCLVAETVTPHG